MVEPADDVEAVAGSRAYLTFKGEATSMPQGSKASYSPKQKRMASHIEESVQKRGRGRKTAQRVAWATVNKKTGGAKGKKAASRRKSSRTSRGRKSSRSH